MDAELDELMPHVVAVIRDGPKSVGKTGSAKRRAVGVWMLDEPGQRELLRADFGFGSIAPEGTVLFDE